MRLRIGRPALPAHSWIRYGQLGLVAFFIDGYAPTVNLLAEDLRLPLSLVSIHASAFGAGVMLASLLAPRLALRLGRGRTLMLGLLGLASSALVYVGMPWFWGTLLGIGLTGCFGTLVQSSAYADLAVRHPATQARVFNEAGVVAQSVGICAPLLIGVASATVWGWRAGFLLVVVAIVFFAAINGRAGEVQDRQPPDGGRARRSRGRLPRGFPLAWLSTVAVLGIEYALILWSPAWLVSRTQAAPALATASPTVVFLGILIGRAIVSRVSRTHSATRLLLISILVSVVAYCGYWASTSWPLSLAFLFVAGLGVAGQFPLALARLVSAARHDVDRASALGMLALGLAIALGPVMLGVLEAVLGLPLALGLVPALGAASALLIFLQRAVAAESRAPIREADLPRDG